MTAMTPTANTTERIRLVVLEILELAFPCSALDVQQEGGIVLGPLSSRADRSMEFPILAPLLPALVRLVEQFCDGVPDEEGGGY